MDLVNTRTRLSMWTSSIFSSLPCRLPLSCWFFVGCGYRFCTTEKSLLCSYQSFHICIFTSISDSFNGDPMHKHAKHKPIWDRYYINSTRILVNQSKTDIVYPWRMISFDSMFSWSEYCVAVVFFIMVILWLTQEFGDTRGWAVIFPTEYVGFLIVGDIFLSIFLQLYQW